MREISDYWKLSEFSREEIDFRYWKADRVEPRRCSNIAASEDSFQLSMFGTYTDY